MANSVCLSVWNPSYLGHTCSTYDILYILGIRMIPGLKIRPVVFGLDAQLALHKHWGPFNCEQRGGKHIRHSTKKPVTTMLTYPGNVQFYIVTTWETPGNHWCWWPDTLIIARALVSVRSSAPVVSRCFPGGYNVKLYISRGRLAWSLLAFLHSEGQSIVNRKAQLEGHSTLNEEVGSTSAG